jgi:hypothetical protein
MIGLTLFLKKTAMRLARTDILFWTLPCLMILLIIGTVAQKYIGLHASLNLYFASFITFIGPIPFPGGFTLMGILFINMLMKFLLFSEWSWQKSGVILTHFGALVLIMGGSITALTQKEGYMMITEGESSQTIHDYYEYMLRVYEGDKVIISIPHKNIYEGQIISVPNSPVTLTIDQFCLNCKIIMRPEIEKEGWHAPGSSMKLVGDRLSPDPEKNLIGIEFTVTGAGTKQNGQYLTFDRFPQPPVITADNKKYKIDIAPMTRSLPFTVTLSSFTQNLHAGTKIAKEYISDVLVTDDAGSWPVRIEMNEPLRYKGYTFYQSSFDLSNEKPFTVLNVVENKGQFFPYMATILMLVGLILHLVLRTKKPKDEWVS